MYSKFKFQHPHLGSASLRMFLSAVLVATPWMGYAADTVSVVAPPATTTLKYQSVFADYQKLENFTEPKSTAWRLANQRVETVGGWREYAKEAARAVVPVGPVAPLSSTVPPVTAVPPSVAPNPHQHHGKKP